MRLHVTAFAVILFVATAYAQSSGPPTYSVGDTWTFSTGLEIKVVKVDEDGGVMSGFFPACRTCLYHLDKNLVVLKVVDADGKPPDVTQLGFMPVGPDWKLYDFPLEVKKTWSISAQAFFRGQLRNYTVDCRVAAYEDVKTRAGTFKAYKVVRQWSTQQKLGGGGSWTQTVWFAPDVKLGVKLTSTAAGSQDAELVSYSVK